VQLRQGVLQRSTASTRSVCVGHFSVSQGSAAGCAVDHRPHSGISQARHQEHNKRLQGRHSGTAAGRCPGRCLAAADSTAAGCQQQGLAEANCDARQEERQGICRTLRLVRQWCSGCASYD
jgi:hypothetical protein